MVVEEHKGAKSSRPQEAANLQVEQSKAASSTAEGSAEAIDDSVGMAANEHAALVHPQDDVDFN